MHWMLVLVSTLVGPVETSDFEQRQIQNIAMALYVSDVCRSYEISDAGMIASLIQVGIAPSEIWKGGRRFDILEAAIARAVAFVRQLGEDLQISEHDAACMVGDQSYDANGLVIPGLLVEK